MLRYFFIAGKANTPERFWTCSELCTKTDLLRCARYTHGYIKRVPNEDVNKYFILNLNNIKPI